MKSIFTYPNNSGTSYIDPNYIGDDTVGFQKRVKDLADGNYKPWLGSRPNQIPLRNSIQEVMANMSKYNNESELELNGNNTFYKFWQEPLINTTSELFSEDLDQLNFGVEGGQVVAALTRAPDGNNDALGFYDGQLYDYSGDNWPQFPTTTPASFQVEHAGAFGSAEQDWVYPLVEDQLITAGKFIIGQEYTIVTIGTTDYTLIGAGANMIGYTFTATGAGSGTGTATANGYSYVQPEGEPESFAIFRDGNQLYYAKSHTQGTWDAYKFSGAAVGLSSSNTWFQYDPSYVSNFLLADTNSGLVGNVGIGYQNAASLNGISGGVTNDMTKIVSGLEYVIYIVGSEDFTLIGASSNTVGEVFTATASGVNTSGSRVGSIGNNDKVLTLNGPGGSDVSGNTSYTLALDDVATTFPVELHDGNIDQDNWTELDLATQYLDLYSSGIPITTAQYNTFAGYKAGNIYDDGTPIPNTSFFIDTILYYGFCYMNYEIISGGITSGEIRIGEYNATDYPENVSNIGYKWNNLYTWFITEDNNTGDKRIKFRPNNNFRKFTDLPREYNGYLTVGRKYEVTGGGGSANSAPNNWASAGAPTVSAGNFVIGEKYVIKDVGNTNWASIGGSTGYSGWVFTATGAGSGTGTATEAVFTATSVGIYGGATAPATDRTTGSAQIYPVLGAQPFTYASPDPWDKMRRQNFHNGSSEMGIAYLSNTPDLSELKFRIGFINPTQYSGDLLTLADGQSFAGDMTIASSESKRYRMYGTETILPGNKQYLQRTGQSTYANNPRVVDSKYYLPGESATSTTTMSKFINVSTDGSGYFTQAILDPRQPGQFSENSDRAIVIETTPDSYTPPAPTPAEEQDIWDTDDEWTTNGFSSAKEWPFHITPKTATINYNSPTITNNSQSGVKYTRSVGHTKWTLEVEYPPMSVEDFQKFHAVAQAAHGQSTPFFFVLRDQYGGNILWSKMDGASTSTSTARLKTPITKGDTTMFVEGFASDESDVFIRGEVFIDGSNENGFLHTSLSGTDSNIYGEAKIRTPWPFRSDRTAGDEIYKDPYHAVVTLASDNFEYQVDTAGYYYVSVAFDLDGWK